MLPNYKRVREKRSTVQVINDIFAADDEVICKADSFSAASPGVRNEGPVHIKSQLERWHETTK